MYYELHVHAVPHFLRGNQIQNIIFFIEKKWIDFVAGLENLLTELNSNSYPFH